MVPDDLVIQQASMADPGFPNHGVPTPNEGVPADN